MVEKEKINFALEEYKAIREEIMSKMGYQYKVLSLGVGGITIFFGAIFEFQLYELFLVLPILIFANDYLYHIETRTIIRAGNYIKKIENSIYRNNSNLDKSDEDKVFGDIGWENWLDRNKIKQYIHFGLVADMIFGSLYIISVAGAWIYTQDQFPHTALWVAMGAYLIILVFWLFSIRKTKLIEKKIKNLNRKKIC